MSAISCRKKAIVQMESSKGVSIRAKRPSKCSLMPLNSNRVRAGRTAAVDVGFPNLGETAGI